MGAMRQKKFHRKTGAKKCIRKTNEQTEWVRSAKYEYSTDQMHKHTHIYRMREQKHTELQSSLTNEESKKKVGRGEK